jgi:hypothetical protein
MSRNRIIFILVAVIAVVAATFPLWSPLFRTDAVDEAFPSLSAAQQDAIREMPADQQAALIEMAKDNPDMAADTAAAMLEPDTSAADAMPAQPTALSQGTFIRIDAVHAAEGTATIYDVGSSRVLRLENFRSTNGPGLHVLLSKKVPTTTFEGAGEDAIDLGKLKGNVGNQNYDIPAEIDLSDYQSVVIYCVPFGVVFSSAALSPAS